MSGPSFEGPSAGPQATFGHFFSEPIMALLADFGGFLKLAIIPVMSVLLLYVLSGIVGIVTFATLMEEIRAGQTTTSFVAWNFLASLLFGLLYVVPMIVFAIAWIRRLLLGPERVGLEWLPAWSPAHTRCLIYGIVYSLGSTVLGILLFLLATLLVGALAPEPMSREESAVLLFGSTGVGSLLHIAVSLIVILRVGPAIPAAAVGEGYGAADAWRDTRPFWIRLTLAALLQGALLLFGLVVVGGLVWGFLFQILFAPMGGLIPLVLTLIVVILTTLAVLAVFLGLITEAFRLGSGWTPTRLALAGRDLPQEPTFD